MLPVSGVRVKLTPVRAPCRAGSRRAIGAAGAQWCDRLRVYLKPRIVMLASMPASSTAATEDTVPEPLLLTIGPAGVLSRRAISPADAVALWRLLGPPHERQRRDVRRLTDVVLIENDATIYWPRTGELFPLPHATHALAPLRAALVGNA